MKIVSAFPDGLWRHLTETEAADHIRLPSPNERRRLTRPIVGVGAATLLVVVATMALVSGITTTIKPAYALTVTQTGSFTLSLLDVARGAPAVNARFVKLGMRETVIPVRNDCTMATPRPLTVGITAASETITVNTKDIPDGEHGFLAAKQLPDGKVLLASGWTSSPIPPCLNDLIGTRLPTPTLKR
jgi:hypothetical protein